MLTRLGLASWLRFLDRDVCSPVMSASAKSSLPVCRRRPASSSFSSGQRSPCALCSQRVGKITHAVPPGVERADVCHHRPCQFVGHLGRSYVVKRSPQPRTCGGGGSHLGDNCPPQSASRVRPTSPSRSRPLRACFVWDRGLGSGVATQREVMVDASRRTASDQRSGEVLLRRPSRDR
jgi:hypothetical protein